MKAFLQEFETFALRGNVVDLAVAVVIGTAFGKIVSSLVDTIITPLIGLLIGGIDFTEWSIAIGDVSVAFGVFIQSVIDFTIIAFVIFLIIRVIRKIRGKKEKTPLPPREEVLLLREIRDSVKR